MIVLNILLIALAVFVVYWFWLSRPS